MQPQWQVPVPSPFGQKTGASILTPPAASVYTRKLELLRAVSLRAARVFSVSLCWLTASSCAAPAYKGKAAPCAHVATAGTVSLVSLAAAGEQRDFLCTARVFFLGSPGWDRSAARRECAAAGRGGREPVSPAGQGSAAGDSRGSGHCGDGAAGVSAATVGLSLSAAAVAAGSAGSIRS